MKEVYQIREKAEGFFKDRGSKFFAYAFPFYDTAEIETLLGEVRAKHKNANHFCFAFQIGSGDSAQIRVNDDGEPSGSAGLPILNQIKSAELTDIFIVVAREFGGTKLGVSGLINAYKTAAHEAIQHVEKFPKINYRYLELEFGFEVHGDIMSLISRNQLEIQDQEFGKKINFKIKVKESELENILALFQPFADKVNLKVMG